MPATHSARNHRSPEQIARTRRWHIVLLSLLILIVYASALFGGFVWSDREDILQGAYRFGSLAGFGASLSSSGDAFRSLALGSSGQGTAGGWQPLTIFSNTFSWSLWGDCAFCFHLENILLHGLLVVGLYALGRHLLSRRRHGNRIAFWAAALFAAHPATVSSVAWIGGRPYLLAALLGVWTLVIFTRLQATTNSRQGHVNRWLGGLFVASLGAMLAHETSYLLPLAALLIAIFESRERGRRALSGISPLRRKALALLTGVLVLVLMYRWSVVGGLGFAAGYPDESTVNNIGTALRHLWFLIEQTLLPGEPIISDAWPITLGWTATEVAALLGLLLLLVATLLGLKLGHPSAFGVAWFLLWLIPGVGVFPSDHYHSSHALYFAAWGIVFAVSYAIFLLWRPIGRQLMPGSEAVVYVPIILVLGIITAFSNARWWDHAALFESEIASDPHYMEGRLELAKASLEKGDAASALNHALAAIEASRDAAYTGFWSPRDGYLLLGRAQLEMGMLQDAAGSFRAALDGNPEDATVLYWLGVAYLHLGEFESAEVSLRNAIASRPAFTEAEADLGVALAGQQRFVEAYPLLAAATANGLGNARRHRALALTMIDANQLEAAIAQLELSLSKSETADDRARLAWVEWRLGRTEQARSDLDAALQLDEQSSDYVLSVRAQIEAAQAPTPTEPPVQEPQPPPDDQPPEQ